MLPAGGHCDEMIKRNLSKS